MATTVLPNLSTSGPISTSTSTSGPISTSTSTLVPIWTRKSTLEPNSTYGQHYSWRVVLTMGNDVVLVTVCIVLAIHVMICVFQIIYRWVAGKIPLYAKCRYGRRLSSANDFIVTLVTGCRPDSGTYGNLRMKLHGQYANSDDIFIATTLNEAVLGLPLLKRGHSDAFIISSSENLGNIQYMEVELSTDSVAESWFLSYATVLDLGNQAHWHLPCHRWFQATIRTPHNQILLAETADYISLWLDNFYRCFRELHLWMAPWCSSLLATRLQMLYSLTLCYCAVASLMFVYMLVFYAPFGAPHPVSQRSFTASEIVYLVFSSFFITFIITVLQLLMRIVSLKSGAFLSNYAVVCVGNSGDALDVRATDEPDSPDMYEDYGDRNAGNNVGDDRSFGDNVNWNAAGGAEGMLGKWEKMWNEVKPVTEYSSVAAVSGVLVLHGDALETWLRPLVEELCAAGVKLLDDDLNLEPLEEALVNSLKEVFGGLTVNSSFLAGRGVSSIGTNVGSDGENFATNYSEWSAAATRVSNTTDAKVGLQFAGKPTVELLSHSISVRATNSALFLLELKAQDALDAVASRCSRNLQLVHDSGDAPRSEEKKRIRRFFWDYTHATLFNPEDVLSMQCAELLTCERLQSIATKTLSEVISLDLFESIDTTLDAYIDRELRDFIAKVVRISYTAIRNHISDHKTLLRYQFETTNEVCEEVKSGIFPNIVRSVTQALSDELASLQDLVWKLRMTAIAGKHMNVILNNLSLNIYVQFCRMLAGRRNFQTRFCDVFTATETGRVVENLCSSDAGAMKVEMLARIRKVLLEVELIKREDMIVNGRVKFQDGRDWSSEREITCRVIRQMYEKMFATTSCDEKLSDTTKLPEIREESSRFIWVLVVKDARTLFRTSLRTIRRNVHGCRIESLATLGQALWGQISQAPQLSILESVRAEMEDGMFGLAIESVADRILEVTAILDEDEALAELSAVWSDAAEVTNGVTSLWGMEQFITDSDDAFDTNNNNQVTDRKKITVGEVLGDFRNLRNRLTQFGNVANRLIDQKVRNNSKTSQLTNQNTQHNSDKNQPSNQKVRQDFNGNKSANHAAQDSVTDYYEDQTTNQNNAVGSKRDQPQHATVQVETPQSNISDMMNTWADDGSSLAVLTAAYILFVMLVVLCAASLAGTLALGVTLSSSEAWSWVRVLCFGLSCHFILLETFKVCLIAFFFAAWQRKLIM